MAEAFQREHARRELGAPPIRALERFGPRLFRPLVGGAVGAAIIVLFLSLRGGPADRGSRRADRHPARRLEPP